VYKKIGISALQRQLTIAQAEMQHDIPIFPIGVNLSRSPFGFTIAIELDDTASETIMTDKKIAAEALELEEPRGARMLQIGNYDTLEQAGEAARHVRTYLDELPKDHPFMTLAPARIKVFQSL